MGFGKKLEQKMNEKGLKQADIVRATGIPKTTLSSMINNDNRKVDVEYFIRICNILDCKPEDFSEEILEATNIFAALTADEKTLLDGYRSFNNKGKEKLLDILSDMMHLDRYKK